MLENLRKIAFFIQSQSRVFIILGAAGAMVSTMLDFVRELKSLQQDMRAQVSNISLDHRLNI